MKSSPEIYLVIPTTRNLHFLSEWKNQLTNCHLIIVEDNSTKTIDVPSSENFKSVQYFNYQDISHDLGQNSWIISRKDSGIRTFGYLKAYQLGADYIFTLDDDCFPAESNFVEKHVDNLNFRASARWLSTYPNPKWAYTRGFPYEDRQVSQVVISHGLWSGALDLDGRTERKLPELLTESPYPPLRQVIPPGYYYPMCGMNLAFKAEIAPIMFFPMMGVDPEAKPWGVHRFDDIWAGILSKKIIDHLGYAVVSGSPFVDHRKASDPGSNYLKEKTGVKINEDFWKWVDAVKLTKSTPKDCYIELAEKAAFPKTRYFNRLKEAMIIWANLF